VTRDYRRKLKMVNLIQFKKDLDRDLKSRFGDNTKTWVWPERHGVKQFYGDGQINNAVVIWIMERPSLGEEKKETDKPSLWCELLKEAHLENMHVTDFVKIRAEPGKKPTKEELDANAEWMCKEIELLRVRGKRMIIVANAKEGLTISRYNVTKNRGKTPNEFL
jgi:hypothetical protein